MKNSTTKKIVLAGLFLALGLLLPSLTGQIPSIGKRLLPMHIPVLLAGFALGGPYGLIVGLITPVLRSALFGMPPLFPNAAAMSFELAAYGLLAGLLYKVLPKQELVNIRFPGRGNGPGQGGLGCSQLALVWHSGQSLYLADVHCRRICRCHPRHHPATCPHPGTCHRPEGGQADSQ
ncbi:MAG: ECF transporter S component [Bacillota bacterium]